jgi:hypothetical protein
VDGRRLCGEESVRAKWSSGFECCIHLRVLMAPAKRRMLCHDLEGREAAARIAELLGGKSPA